CPGLAFIISIPPEASPGWHHSELESPCCIRLCLNTNYLNTNYLNTNYLNTNYLNTNYLNTNYLQTPTTSTPTTSKHKLPPNNNHIDQHVDVKEPTQRIFIVCLLCDGSALCVRPVSWPGLHYQHPTRGFTWLASQ
ncbi:hypothetical protein NHX12_003786, partial [Muraenolepis orangiensis]